MRQSKLGSFKQQKFKLILTFPNIFTKHSNTAYRTTTKMLI